MVETRRLPLHITNSPARETNPQAMSRLLGQTAHFFLSYRYSTRDTMLAMEPNAPRTDKIVEVICILPPRDRFPARAVYTPPFRLRGMTGNRLLPHTVYKGGKNSTWTVGFHLKSIIQYSVVLSNKLRHLRFPKVSRKRMPGTGIKITEFPLDNPVLLCYCMNTLIQQYRRREM